MLGLAGVAWARVCLTSHAPMVYRPREARNTRRTLPGHHVTLDKASSAHAQTHQASASEERCARTFCSRVFAFSRASSGHQGQVGGCRDCAHHTSHSISAESTYRHHGGSLQWALQHQRMGAGAVGTGNVQRRRLEALPFRNAGRGRPMKVVCSEAGTLAPAARTALENSHEEDATATTGAATRAGHECEDDERCDRRPLHGRLVGE